MKLEPGDRLGDWIIDRSLGAGGMGSVYRAHSVLSPDVLAAIKVLTPSNTGDIEARFVGEMRTLSTLSHPAIVRVLGGGRDEARGLLYMAMELVDGEDLDARLRRGPMDADTIARVFGPVADALAYAHERGVAHRDIKPGNIMLRADGSPVIVDFGIAVVSGQTRHTREGMVPGTMVYLPPEVFQGDLPDPRSTDAYALGVVVWESVTGRTAFEAAPSSSEGQQLAQVMGQKLRAEALDPGADAPPGIRDAVLRTTDPEPGERLIDLGRVRDLLVGEAAPDPRPRRRRARKGRRSWVAPVLLALVAVTLVGALAVAAAGSAAVAGVVLWRQPVTAARRAAVPLDESLALASAALSAGELSPARLHAGHAVDDHPEDPHANLVYGQLLLQEGHLLLARPYLCAAVEGGLGDRVPGHTEGSLSCTRGPGASLPLTAPLALASLDLDAAVAQAQALADARAGDGLVEGGGGLGLSGSGTGGGGLSDGAPSPGAVAMDDEAEMMEEEPMYEAPEARDEASEPAAAGAAPEPVVAAAPEPVARRAPPREVADQPASSRATAAPTVRSVSVDVRGSLDPAVVTRVLARARTGVQRCYERALSAEPGLSGTIRFVIRVGADGRVSDITVREDQVGGVVGACAHRMLGRTAFPAANGDTIIALTLSFEGG